MKLRPYVKEVLQNLSRFYEIMVFTASHSAYANTVIDLLDPEKKIVSRRLFRDNCFKSKDNILIKDLRILKNRKLEDIIIVDNSLYCYGFQLANGIPILPFLGASNDNQLLELETFLLKLVTAKDVNKLISGHFAVNTFEKLCDKQSELLCGLLEDLNQFSFSSFL